MEQTEKHAYVDLYNSFLSDYKRGMVSGEEVGEAIVRLAGYFGEYNIKLVSAERSFANVRKTIASSNDESTGKSISSAKADVLADATNEANLFNIAKAHLQNIEQYINALKALQKGVLNEYAHSSM